MKNTHFKPRFKFCSLPRPFNIYKSNKSNNERWNTHKEEYLNSKLTSPPPLELIPTSCYKEGAYWIRYTPTLIDKAQGYVYFEGNWYKWEGLLHYERWNPPKSLSNKEKETLDYLINTKPQYLTNEIKEIIYYWKYYEQTRKSKLNMYKINKKVLKKN